MTETILSGRSACQGCVIACGRVVTLKGDKFKRKGPEHETMVGFGANLLNDNLEAIVDLGELCDRYGMDTGGYSFPYVAGWARKQDVLKRNLGEIQRVSHHLISAIEGTPLEEHGAPPTNVPESDERAALREQLDWGEPQ